MDHQTAARVFTTVSGLVGQFRAGTSAEVFAPWPGKAAPKPQEKPLARSVRHGDALRISSNCDPCWFLLASLTMMRTYKSFGLAVAVLLAGVSTSFGAAVIGNTSDGTSTDGLWFNGAWINACRFQAASNMTVVTMHAKVAAITGKYKCAIYSDSSSLPNRLLRGTAEVSNPSTGWQTFTLTAPQPLTNGNYYWLAIWSDSTSAQAYYTAGASGTLRWVQANYVAAWPDPITTTDGGTNRYCIYAQAATAPLVSMAVTPANPTITAGNTQQFTATGTYSDSSTQNLTSQATWNSSNTTRATINTTGLATGLTAGTTTISATLSGISGNTLLTVQPAPPTVVISSPANNSTAGHQLHDFRHRHR